MKRTALLTLFLALILAACGTTPATTAPAANPTGAVQVVDAWARPSAGAAEGHSSEGHATGEGHTMGDGHAAGGNGAAYMTIRGGAEADRLLRAESDVAEAVEIHTVENDGGVMRMRPVEGIDIPAGGQVELKPGGFHIMMINLQRELKPGDSLSLTLRFEKAGAVSVEATVREQ